MISAQQTFTALYGAYRLARLDTGGMKFFDQTIDGFWRSFYAAVIVAPLFILFLAVSYDPEKIAAGPVRYIIIEGIAYVMAWYLFPLIMLNIVQAMDRAQQYLGYIVAYNWASVWQNFIYLPVAILAGLGVVNTGAIAFISTILIAAIVAYSWFIARTALQIAGGMAAMIVVFEWSLSIFLRWITQFMLQAGA